MTPSLPSDSPHDRDTLHARTVHGLLKAHGLDQLVTESHRVVLVRDLKRLEEQQQVGDEAEFPPRVRLAQALERLALSLPPDEGGEELFREAFLCRRAVPSTELTAERRWAHLACLAADALAADRLAELVMILREEDTREPRRLVATLAWPDELLLRVLRAFVLVARRSNGWDDLTEARAEIARLRDLQARRERDWVDGADSQSLAHLMAVYNLARMVELVAEYVVGGAPGDADVRLDRHHANVVELLERAPEPALTHLGDLIHLGARRLVEGSVWTATRTYGADVRKFVDALADQAREEPVLELWPSQREALRDGLVDVARRAVVVEMPTSAGKTLAAEFAIVQALALNPGWAVTYVVPTRALVNQITLRLRRDFEALNYRVEAAVPVFELDPVENEFLVEEKPDVLVTTPEKLDLLVRSNHPVVTEISLVVADEAHNLGNTDRGPRLELLLATIKRERRNARFVLLTPFMPNVDEIRQWLDDGGQDRVRPDSDAKLQLKWKPTELVTAAGLLERQNARNHLVFRTLPSAHHTSITDEIDLDLGPAPGVSKSQVGLAARIATQLTERGTVLVLCPSRPAAEDRATAIADARSSVELTEFGTAVAAFAATELGGDHPLPRLLERRVCFHHAGLSHDLRYLLERLIDRNEIDVVCGTTTLAQGVNFPIASVVVQSLDQFLGGGRKRKLTFDEFWNIAGRAGRALRDRVGVVVYPASEPRHVDEFRDYLQNEAHVIASGLLEAVDKLEETEQELDMEFFRENRAMGVFTQYLAHALLVTGAKVQSEVEDLLRSSLVFSQARARDPDAARRLIRFARQFLDENALRNPGTLRLADGTGFSLKSVDYLMARQRKDHPEFRTGEFWSPSSLFSPELDSLTAVVEVLGRVPELRLGTSETGQLNPRRVAAVLQDWVNGKSVAAIADAHFSAEKDRDKRLRRVGQYLHGELVGQVPWGMGAMQKVALSPTDQQTVGYVPSCVFYGVRTKGAAAMRMAGAPRIAAEGLANAWTRSESAQSLADCRDWLAAQGDATWSEALPEDAPITGRQARLLWSELSASPLPSSQE